MGLLSKLFGKGKESEPKKQIVTDEPSVFTGILDRSPDVNNVYIAGLSHHCSKRDAGFFSGVIYNEKDNPYDKKAMAIWNHQTKKIIGYVPGAVLDEYRSWCKRKNCPCVGYIFYDSEHLRGRVRSYLPTADQAELIKDAQEYARQVCEHFGWPVPDIS